jgi:hypothetical protein
MNAVQIVHRGGAFAARGKGLFAKDVVHDGTWVHPLTGRVIEFTSARRENLARNVERYLKGGNKIPMPDGHVIDTSANKGFWPGPFTNIDRDLYGVAEPRDEKTREQLSDGTADAVSVNVEFNHVDPEANAYDEVFTHICLTNYPVVTRQKKFIALSGVIADEHAPLLIKEVLAGVAVPEEDEALVEALNRFNATLEQAVNAPATLTPTQALAAALTERALSLRNK